MLGQAWLHLPYQQLEAAAAALQTADTCLSTAAGSSQQVKSSAADADACAQDPPSSTGSAAAAAPAAAPPTGGGWRQRSQQQAGQVSVLQAVMICSWVHAAGRTDGQGQMHAPVCRGRVREWAAWAGHAQRSWSSGEIEGWCQQPSSLSKVVRSVVTRRPSIRLPFAPPPCREALQVCRDS